MRSELTFENFINLMYTKIVWNGKVIFDENDKTKRNWQKVEKKYKNKVVYSLYAFVKDFHHVELYIEGQR